METIKTLYKMMMKSNDDTEKKSVTEEKKNTSERVERDFLPFILKTKLPDKCTGNNFILVIGLDDIDQDQNDQSDQAQKTQRS